MDYTKLLQIEDRELSLEDLVEESETLIARLGLSPEDGRVAARPDARIVRYYQTFGLLDRPTSYRGGRQAIYRRRHVLQLIAIKALQVKGLSLRQIQSALLSRPESDLIALIAERAEAKPREALPAAIVAQAPALPMSMRPAEVGRSLLSVELAPGATLLVEDSVLALLDAASIGRAAEAAIQKLRRKE